MSETLTMDFAPPSTTTPIAFEALYRSSADEVYAYVLSLLRDRPAAEDVTAQAFERAYRRQKRYDARKGTPRQWLFGIARNAALDELRRRGRTASLLVDPQDPAAVEPFADEAVDADRRATVQAALAAMDARDRELISLKFHAGLSNAEIAGVLGVSATNAGTRVHRAVAKLRKACA